VRREIEILRARQLGLSEALAGQVARAVAYLRQSDKVTKKPSVAESLDWALALTALGADELDDENVGQTLGFALKNNDDIREIMADDEFIRTIL
jgi:MoxR-like ATPase